MAPIVASDSVQGLLKRMTNADKDYRFMATNDLMSELQRENICWDDDSETKITKQIISLLRDQNGEVQNLAVKCLSHLVRKIKDDRRRLVIQSLCSMLTDEAEQVRDIASIALKSIVPDIPVNKSMIDILNNDLNPNLLIAIQNGKDVNVQLESLDIFIEVINRCGPQLEAYHENMQCELLIRLDSDKSAVRKRSIIALSSLMTCCSNNLFESTLNQLAQALRASAPQSPEEFQRFNSSNCSSPQSTEAKTILQCIAAIIRSAGHRSSIELLLTCMPVIHTLCEVEDEEIREYCLLLFEAYVKRSPVKSTELLDQVINVALTSICYDPNYNYDDDDTNMDLDDGAGDDESDSADDYSDEDDMSWKVRRAGAKCLETIIIARKDLINYLIVKIGDELVARFKEREETVKADIIQTYLTLVRQARSIINDTKGLTEAPVNIKSLEVSLEKAVPRSAALLKDRSLRIRRIVFQLLTEVTNLIPNSMDNYIFPLITASLFSLSDKNSTSNIKIDAIAFIQELIKTHQPQIFHPHIPTLLDSIVNSTRDSFYKVAGESLHLLSNLVLVMRPENSPAMPNYAAVASKIYDTVIERMSRTDIDQEIKEQAITCAGQLVATFGDVLANQLPVAFNLLHERLDNETTRLITVKTLTKILNTPLDIPLDGIFPRALQTINPFLRKNSRPLLVATLTLIDSVAKRCPDLLNAASAQVILADVPNLIGENDLYMSQLAWGMLTTLLERGKVSQPIIADAVLPQTLNLIRSPLLQGSAQQVMLQFFSTLVKSSLPGLDHQALLARLIEPIHNGSEIHKQAYSSTAKSIAAISVHNSSLAIATVQKLVNDLQRHSDNDRMYTLILLAAGEVGRLVDLGSVNGIVEVILQAFSSSSEDVKSAGSFALGCIAVGNPNKFLPLIWHEISARSKRQYLILHSLREVITAGRLQDYDVVWDLLLKHCECPEEGTRNVVSECLGKLTLLQPSIFLPKLSDHLKNAFGDKPLARSTLVAAIKFTISEQPQEIDNLLHEYIGNFLRALKDEDVNVRRGGLIVLNSAAHNKPSLIVGLLPELLPLLYDETRIRLELIREVEMGPFKHQVDDGLDSRKAAFECMYTLLDSCQNQLDILEFLNHVESGLRDHYDIKMLTYLMLNRLVALYPGAVMQRMDVLIQRIADVLQHKPKESAIKQEHEKNHELRRSALKAYDALKSIPNANKHPQVISLYDSVINVDETLLNLYNSLHADRLPQSSSIQPMDTN